MARGGKRIGAGRKAGGANRASKEAMAMAAEGESPLEYMLRVMRDPDAQVTRRDDMAKAAAPFCHHRLATTEITGKNGGPIETRLIDARAELQRKLAGQGSGAT